ncbi:mannitol dehydrogenase family protein [Maritalea mobilis]|uniref:mannitol dehydrogenase family protein n=1 Tax=Maritalea mobilis TaxID=483324 RepID=UPI001C988F28|nr:mannitol dehydrogenase family protein [Maritalea mobilis]MBY6201718.1 mannitol dehydrogenase family protein [Maritalea mobilis]
MPRILHLGFGNFHRAHQAWYTAHAPGDWKITGVSMRTSALRDALSPAGFAYDLGILSPEGLQVERIAVHDRLLVAAEDPAAVIEEIADPDVQVVTLTVTEKGYHLGPDGRLALDDTAIQRDLGSEAPVTAIGLLAGGLRQRASNRSGPLTILSCDNLSGNGRKLQAAVGSYLAAAGQDPKILSLYSFPDSMVDRITPATTEDTRNRIAAVTGRKDAAPVLTEAFTDWIIADRFAADRPAWDTCGARFVPDVAPYEARKLLMLNGAHSTLAYAGLLAGHTYVHEAIADVGLAALIRAFWREAAPLLPQFDQGALDQHGRDLVDRFSVPGVRHRLDQIAMDGSLKLPLRVLPVLRHHGFAAPAATRAIAAWIALVSRRVETRISLDDPAEDALRDAFAPSRPPVERVNRALACLGIAEGDAPRAWTENLAATVFGT